MNLRREPQIIRSPPGLFYSYPFFGPPENGFFCYTREHFHGCSFSPSPTFQAIEFDERSAYNQLSRHTARGFNRQEEDFMTYTIRIGAVTYLNTKPLIYQLEALAPQAELVLDY